MLSLTVFHLELATAAGDEDIASMNGIARVSVTNNGLSHAETTDTVASILGAATKAEELVEQSLAVHWRTIILTDRLAGFAIVERAEANVLGASVDPVLDELSDPGPTPAGVILKSFCEEVRSDLYLHLHRIVSLTGELPSSLCQSGSLNKMNPPGVRPRGFIPTATAAWLNRFRSYESNHWPDGQLIWYSQYSK